MHVCVFVVWSNLCTGVFDVYCSCVEYYTVHLLVHTLCTLILFTISAVGNSVSVMNTLADWGQFYSALRCTLKYFWLMNPVVWLEG